MSRRYVCYLICFRDPLTGEPARYQHAGHYLGHTEAKRLTERLREHLSGHGAVLTAVVHRAGLDFKVTRTWDGGALKERQLKTRSGALYCPDCSEHPLPGTRPRRPGAKYLTRRQREDRRREPGEPIHDLENIPPDNEGEPVNARSQQNREKAQAEFDTLTVERKEAMEDGRHQRVREIDAYLDQTAHGRALREEIQSEREAYAAQLHRRGCDLTPDEETQLATMEDGWRAEAARRETDAEVGRLAARYPEPGDPADWLNTSAPGPDGWHLRAIAAIREDMLTEPDPQGRREMRTALRRWENDYREYRASAATGASEVGGPPAQPAADPAEEHALDLMEQLQDQFVNPPDLDVPGLDANTSERHEQERLEYLSNPALWTPDLWGDTDGQYERDDDDHNPDSDPDDAHDWTPPTAPDPRDLTLRHPPPTGFDLAVQDEEAARIRLRHEAADMRLAEQARDRHPSAATQLAVEEAQQHVRQAWGEQRAAEEDAHRRWGELQDADRDPPGHLYGSPECTEPGAEDAHFGSQPGEPHDAGQWAPHPRSEAPARSDWAREQLAREAVGDEDALMARDRDLMVKDGWPRSSADQMALQHARERAVSAGRSQPTAAGPPSAGEPARYAMADREAE